MKRFYVVLCMALLSSCGGSSGSGDQADTSDGNGSSHEWLIPESEVLDGGPGKDGIPAIDDPSYLAVSETRYLDDSDLVAGSDSVNDETERDRTSETVLLRYGYGLTDRWTLGALTSYVHHSSAVVNGGSVLVLKGIVVHLTPDGKIR